MRILTSITILTVLLFLLTGCPIGYRFDQGRFPSDPVNFATANSEYDDYNSASPVIESERYLYFSSNRNSQGAEYDLVGSNFRVFWDKDDGVLIVDDKPHSWRSFEYTDSLFARLNTPANELGPYSIMGYSFISSYYTYTDMLICSGDSAGNHDLKMSWFIGEGETPTLEEGEIFGPAGIDRLNSPANDAYLCFYGPYFLIYDYSADPSMITELILSSDRGGNFDLYSAPVPADTALIEFLQNEGETTLDAIQALNSPAQDKCPFVNGRLLVFASDRPGGYGGFDLYYSLRMGDEWLEPVNFGERINTPYNEYRPVALQYYEFINDLVIFSSDRPGGKGGYDLYYAGIPKMIDPW
jgi:hypothetical protein